MDTPRARYTRQIRFSLWICLALGVMVLDQLSKRWFDAQLGYADRWQVLPFFDFTLLYNPGAAFSFLAHGHGWQRWFFTIIAIIAIGYMLVLLWRQPAQRLFCASVTLILGGAAGNVLDRMVHGHVIDFLLFYWKDWFFPAFNVADIAITCGAILLILDEFFRWRHAKRS